ncbi:probable WRKY transcription factor 41 isoform X2 [Primulina huaijiensis]|uniref:probable WRKY transcription factor 41 isoform X2 n=1 Tax=Primulina huaijiensis TaxID=1492673 RepID=UPI003CC76788
MEEVCSRSQNTLVGLMQGREFVNQLKLLFQLSNSTEKYEFFVEKIESSFDNAIALINSMEFLEHETPSHTIGNTSASPNLLENSSKNEGSDPDYTDQTHKGVSKKRKMTRKWNDVVRVCSGAGIESHLNDGYSWRKYGQKVILNTDHPRAYYRCTYLNTQRCLAKKHVQRTDYDPSIFEVVYKGKHSCVQETVKQNKGNLVFSSGTRPGLKVETRELDVTDGAMANFRTFSFPSTPVESEISGDTPLFFDLSKEANFIGSYSTPFLSPATSESCFSLSQDQVNGFVIGDNLCSETEFTEIISSSTTSTFEDIDLSIDRVDFGTKFLDAFDNFC